MSDDARCEPDPRCTNQQCRAYDSKAYPWNLTLVPRTLRVGIQEMRHPALTSAIFVVHGIGEQQWTETSAGLRSGFEDAVIAIRKWQSGHPELAAQAVDPLTIPPPFTLDGYWSNYTDLQKTFPEAWEHFEQRDQEFFGTLWEQRTLSIPRVFRWFIRQQLRLLQPSVLREVGLLRWLLHLPLQLIAPVALTLGTLRWPKLFTGFLSDVRLYLDPRGVIERAIVQRIDYRVGAQFLQLLGLDWEFLPLRDAERLRVGPQVVQFERIVWVAHSLGTVISFNVLSDLQHRAAEILGSKLDEEASSAERQRLEQQQQGARRFRLSLEQFITLGSPLEKAAFLFCDALRPWPPDEATVAETFDWVNFHHLLDPVSGRLRNQRLLGSRRPTNYHCRSGWIPGLAHVAYWTDTATLRFILSRAYGKRVLPDCDYAAFSRPVQWLVAIGVYGVWVALLFGAAGYAAYQLASLWQGGWESVWKLIALAFPI